MAMFVLSVTVCEKILMYSTRILTLNKKVKKVNNLDDNYQDNFFY